MTQDPEIAAMEKVAAALEDISDDQRTRVVSWAANRFGVSLKNPRDRENVGDSSARRVPSVFQDFAALYDAADPKGEQNRALVSCYWFQELQGSPDVDALVLNDALKDMGQGIGNITKAMTRLQTKRPAFIRQVKKAGKAKQARKKYRLTGAGIKAVEAMLNADARSESDGGA